MEGEIKRNSKTKPSRPRAPSSSDNVLIRQLVAQIDSGRSLLPHSPDQESAVKRVLVDTEVDGGQTSLLSSHIY
jgi:hypothetical protein